MYITKEGFAVMIRYIRESGKTTRRQRLLGAVIFTAIAWWLASLWACAGPMLYSVDMRYTPATAMSETNTSGKKLILTVAAFNDARKVNDTAVIGRVITSKEREIPVVPKYVRPGKSVSEGIRKHLTDAGYNVRPGMPDWNVRNETIDPAWGDMLIGGTIEKLEIICRKKMPIREYAANVKLSVAIAHVKESKIRYHITVSSTPSVKDLRFSETMIEEVINDAVTTAITKIFDNQEWREKLHTLSE